MHVLWVHDSILHTHAIAAVSLASNSEKRQEIHHDKAVVHVFMMMITADLSVFTDLLRGTYQDHAPGLGWNRECWQIAGLRGSTSCLAFPSCGCLSWQLHTAGLDSPSPLYLVCAICADCRPASSHLVGCHLAGYLSHPHPVWRVTGSMNLSTWR